VRKILGISAFYHDSAAAITIGGKVIAAAQEERFTRIKQDSSFPKNAILYCMEETGLTIDELDAVVFYDKSFLKFERLLETYYGFAPKGLKSFIKSVPVWVNEKLFLKRNIKNSLQEILNYDNSKLTLLFPEHHLSHAASAFYPSPYDEAAILTIDGVGEWATASIAHGVGKNITIKKELTFPHSLGLLYSAFTYYLGFRVNSGEYKMMGLAPYGNRDTTSFKKYIKIIKDELIEIKDDGSIWLNQKYFNYATGTRMVYDNKWNNLFGLSKRDSEDEINQDHMDLALAIQDVTEEIVIKMAQEAKRLTNSKYICLAGGVALNCVANGKLIEANIFEDVWIQPAAGDAGGALGAALAANHIYYEEELKPKGGLDQMQGAYLGPEYHNLDVVRMAKKYKAVLTKVHEFDQLSNSVAELIVNDKVVGWFQGRMEFGPRALGNRSIIGDARSVEMQLKLNLKIKYRESFRPFAPSVLVEDISKSFKYSKPSPYMLIVKDVNSVDGNYNNRYYKLINDVKKRTGIGLVINTSFNVRGEPIVCSPDDAYRCFMRTEMDYLVINDFIFNKKEQPHWDEKEKWQEIFELD